jgi:hypothetical protein
MNQETFFRHMPVTLTRGLALALSIVLAFGPLLTAAPAWAQGNVVVTPPVPLELPVEVETELGPAGSLKQAPLWKEIKQLLEHPYAQSCVPNPNTTAGRDCVTTAPVQRRPGFGATMPPLNVYPLDFNVLTGEPMRLRTSDGEISWDLPGPLFDPGDDFIADPTARPIIGYLVVDAQNNLVVSKTAESDPAGLLPPHGTIVAVPAVQNGQLVELDGAVIDELEVPLNEEDFLRTDAVGVPTNLRPYVGRPAAEVLGKALFWDMQVGSDGIQACGSCHFHAGTDNRTRNTLNPNHLGGDFTLQVKGPNQDLVASDFPFHKLTNPDVRGESVMCGHPGLPACGPGVIRDSNDVVSSMGVKFRRFVDVPPIGPGSFFSASGNGVRALRPDVGDVEPDPIAAFHDPVTGENLRRVEPRNTPTMHSAAFNFDNFWDGRARFHFNGGSVFGPSDPQRHIFISSGPLAAITGASNRNIRPDLYPVGANGADQPVRIKFSSLASLATGPALSDFEMSFAGRNWAKLGKKLLQPSPLQVLGGFGNPAQIALAPQVVPLANQLVSPTDSELGPFSGQRTVAGGPVDRPGRPGLNISYPALIRLAFKPRFWQNVARHLNGCFTDGRTPSCPAGTTPDPFDGYVLTGGSTANGPANPVNTNQFTQMESNFSLFFGLSLQMWMQLLIPDDTAFDRFLDANPRAGNGVGQPGEQGTLPPSQIPGLVGALVFPDPALFGPEELFGFDIFAGANLTAALPVGSARNPTGVGSNPFLRTARCMLCHLGPEQTDHTINVNHGLLLSDTEFELPPPGAAEPTGPFKFVTGISLAEELGEGAQDGVEVENRNFSVVAGQVASFDPALAPFAREIGLPSAIAFQDNGIYNIGLRPSLEDLGRGGPDPFGWPLGLAALAMKNLAGPDYVACDGVDPCTGPLPNFDLGAEGFGLFEETGEGATYPGTTYTLQSINPGLAMEPAEPLMPPYMAPWLNNLPAGELHPQIDELAFAPNHITHPPFAEFAEIHFGSDQNCVFQGDPTDPVAIAANDWGPRCPNTQSAVPNNFDPVLNGTWPFANRVAAKGAFKAPQLRNVELTGPYFHTGSVLTLRQVVDFYMRGGDFPILNGENRDPNLVDVNAQVFGFGSTNTIAAVPGIVLDGIPDVITRYGAMPDTAQANTPEPAGSNPEAAKVALVRFLLSLTDQRVKFERAPFDRPELFIPLDGAAPDNTGGRNTLLLNSTGNPAATNPQFRQVPAVGAEGQATPLPGFLGVTNNPGADCTTEISHFCR